MHCAAKAMGKPSPDGRYPNAFVPVSDSVARVVQQFYYRAMQCIARTMPSQDDVRLSVRLSHAGILSIRAKHSIKRFSSPGSHTILTLSDLE